MKFCIFLGVFFLLLGGLTSWLFFGAGWDAGWMILSVVSLFDGVIWFINAAIFGKELDDSCSEN